MPTYQYRCQACTNELEAFQKFTDDPLTDCPDCGGSLRKVFAPVGIVFKGSGFYATDSRKSSSASKPATSSPAASSGDSKAAPAEKSGDQPAGAKSKDAAAA
ncbi:MAG: FmdB family zinc ribbon protein [Brooklawnia sp.]|uniref:FmdB family zinc ribbon protein n=1 Tax=Brooklawnia sp. TaxID=2699740 RepID=UPI003C754EA5